MRSFNTSGHAAYERPPEALFLNSPLRTVCRRRRRLIPARRTAVHRRASGAKLELPPHKIVATVLRRLHAIARQFQSSQHKNTIRYAKHIKKIVSAKVFVMTALSPQKKSLGAAHHFLRGLGRQPQFGRDSCPPKMNTVFSFPPCYLLFIGDCVFPR